MKQAIWLVSSSSQRDPDLQKARGCGPRRAGGEATVETGVAPVCRAPSRLMLQLLLALFVIPLMIGWPAIARAEVFYLVCTMDAEHESTTLKIDTTDKTLDDKKADIDDTTIKQTSQLGTTTIDRATGELTFGMDLNDGKHYEMRSKCVKLPNP